MCRLQTGIFYYFSLKKLYSTLKLIQRRAGPWDIQMMLQLFILRVILQCSSLCPLLHTVINPHLQDGDAPNLIDTSIFVWIYSLSINVLIWHSPNVNSLTVRAWKEDSVLNSFYFGRLMVRRNMIKLILPGGKVCHGNIRTKVCFWK